MVIVGSHPARSRKALESEDLVFSIVQELQPWTRPKSDVVAAVYQTIEELREQLTEPPDIGFRSENIQIAREFISIVDYAVQHLARLPPTFIASFSRASYLNNAPVIRSEEDIQQYWRRKHEEEEKLRNELNELRERLTRVVEQ